MSSTQKALTMPAGRIVKCRKRPSVGPIWMEPRLTLDAVSSLKISQF